MTSFPPNYVREANYATSHTEYSASYPVTQGIAKLEYPARQQIEFSCVQVSIPRSPIPHHQYLGNTGGAYTGLQQTRDLYPGLPLPSHPRMVGHNQHGYYENVYAPYTNIPPHLSATPGIYTPAHGVPSGARMEQYFPTM